MAPLMKTCHVCGTDFPSGLTCPGCGAFVVDPPPEESGVAGGVGRGDDRRDDAGTPGTDLELPAPGSLGGWVVPATPARPPVEPGALGGWVTPPPATPARPTGVPADRQLARPGPPRPAPPGGGRPSTTEARTTTGWVYRPPPLPGAAGAPAAAPPDPSPPSPSPPPPPPPSAPRPSSADAAPAVPPPPPAGSLAARVAPITAGLPRATVAPPPPAPPRSGPDPRVLAAIAAAVLVVLIAGVVLLRPKDTGGAGSLADLKGTCIRYAPDRVRLDRSLPCTEPHDGVVLTYVTDGTTCPPETDAVLATQNDAAGSNGVLCIDEGG